VNRKARPGPRRRTGAPRRGDVLAIVPARAEQPLQRPDRGPAVAPRRVPRGQRVVELDRQRDPHHVELQRRQSEPRLQIDERGDHREGGHLGQITFTARGDRANPK
jgi:hypothetical protein